MSSRNQTLDSPGKWIPKVKRKCQKMPNQTCGDTGGKWERHLPHLCPQPLEITVSLQAWDGWTPAPSALTDLA